jgi:hypothetical protein
VLFPFAFRIRFGRLDEITTKLAFDAKDRIAVIPQFILT